MAPCRSGTPTRIQRQWVQVSGSVSATPAAQTRSRIVNGAMQISQEFARESGQSVVALGPNIADQWVMNATTGATAAVGVCTASTTVPGVNWRLQMFVGATPDTSIAAGDIARIYQPVEGIRIADFGWGTASASQVVLRFTANSTMAGTFCVALKNGAGNRSYVRNCVLTAANTNQEFTIIIPGDVTGTWPTTAVVGAYLEFAIMAGSTAQGVEGWQAGNFGATSAISNFFGTANTSFFLSKVGLYLDPLATGIAPPWLMPDEAEELRACQRYYATGLYNIYSSNVVSGSAYYLTTPLPVQPRTTPTLSGVHSIVSGFPGVVGTLLYINNGIRENRSSSVTVNAGYFAQTYTANARM